MEVEADDFAGGIALEFDGGGDDVVFEVVFLGLEDGHEGLAGEGLSDEADLEGNFSVGTFLGISRADGRCEQTESDEAFHAKIFCRWQSGLKTLKRCACLSI